MGQLLAGRGPSFRRGTRLPRVAAALGALALALPLLRVVLGLAAPAWAAAGDLDPTFGIGGKVTTAVERASPSRTPRSTRHAQPRQGSNPRWLTDVNGTLFFAANDRVHGFELWKSDGTKRGTLVPPSLEPGVDPPYTRAHGGLPAVWRWEPRGSPLLRCMWSVACGRALR
jgi:ELWxxDGT repeat protein